MKDFLEVDAALARDIIDQHTTEGQYDTTYPLFIVVRPTNIKPDEKYDSVGLVYVPPIDKAFMVFHTIGTPSPYYWNRSGTKPVAVMQDGLYEKVFKAGFMLEGKRHVLRQHRYINYRRYNIATNSWTAPYADMIGTHIHGVDRWGGTKPSNFSAGCIVLRDHLVVEFLYNVCNSTGVEFSLLMVTSPSLTANLKNLGLAMWEGRAHP